MHFDQFMRTVVPVRLSLPHLGKDAPCLNTEACAGQRAAVLARRAVRWHIPHRPWGHEEDRAAAGPEQFPRPKVGMAPLELDSAQRNIDTNWSIGTDISQQFGQARCDPGAVERARAVQLDP